MEQLVTALKAIADPTRLRLLLLVARSELAVTDLTWIVRQSQPRVSRHLKILTEAGLLERHKEGSWVYYRLAQSGEASTFLPALVESIDTSAPEVARDIERLSETQANRTVAAKRYFDSHAAEWDQMRALYISEDEVEREMLKLLSKKPIHALLDIGTGTGRILEVMAPHIKRGVGIDNSREMLALARVRLDKNSLRHCQVRQGDMYDLPTENGGYDAITLHQVLHFAEDPKAAISEAAVALAPGGRLLVADFAPHTREDLRENHAHRRLGFTDEQIAEYFKAAGLQGGGVTHLKGGPLDVTVWLGERIN
jgi:ubiquinone/menaquinone biosynthesis C-methylase UbiE/predicted DNA-binding transcriptional regulator